MISLPTATLWDRFKYKVYALILIGFIAILIWLATSMFNHKFVNYIPVTLHADRAGLQMHPGNRVKIQGVDLGKVDEVTPRADGKGVVIALSLYPDVAKQVPVNAKVSLEQLTAFGNKTVQLSFPKDPSPQTLRAGSVIGEPHVSVEINDVFQQLTNTLNNVEPAKLNATLSAFAETLRGRGDAIGETAVKANHYLRKLNGNLPQLREDFRIAAGFSNVYADLTPDLLRLLDNVTVTSHTLIDEQDALRASLDGISEVGVDGGDLFGPTAEPLLHTLWMLRSTTSLLREYSPMLTCFLQGGEAAWRSLDKESFDPYGLNVNVVVGYGIEQYKYPRDLPKIGPGPLKGPNCRGLPVIEDGEEHLADATPDPAGARAETNTPQVPQRPVLGQFFGPEALLPGLPGAIPPAGSANHGGR